MNFFLVVAVAVMTSSHGAFAPVATPRAMKTADCATSWIILKVPAVHSRRELLDEIDAEYASLSQLIKRVPSEAWESSRVNSASWSLKDVLAHVADWAERCGGWCELGDGFKNMTPPAPGFKWSETRELNHAIYLKRRGHSLSRVVKDFEAGHAALRSHAETMNEADLLAIGHFGWCGKTWSVAKHIRANTAAHDRWASRHFKAVLRTAGADVRAEKTVQTLPGVHKAPRNTSRTKQPRR